ncbi:molybdopterin converting factor subunit 1 [Ferrovibrio sp.]|uniref:molybdopterin converting factor subunit 1 n=1 Tax=Ferrovibrio sp. TaxID=1917215 RepID=UPI003D28EEC3
MIKLLYFATLRERIGLAEESLALPASITTVGALLDWLRQRGPEYQRALTDPAMVRVAVNQDYARNDDAVKPGDEVALFPPVTGG